MSLASSRFSCAISRGVLSGALLLCSVLSAAHAQDAILAPAPLRVPDIAGSLPALTTPGRVGVAAIIAGSGLSVPSAIQTKDSSTAPAAMNGAASVVLSQLQNGALSAQAAWQSGQLTIAGIVRALNAPNLFESQKPDDVRLRGALVELLLEHGGEKWSPVEGKLPVPSGESLSNRALLGVADALSAQRDERAISIYEAMLVEAERKRGNSRAVGALNHLASFYWDQGKLQQAADVFARGERYSSSLEWAAALKLDGARVYTQMGKPAKAAELYAQIPQIGNEWISGMALYDRASLLLDAQPAQARNLLLQELPTFTKPTNRFGPLWTLAQAQWNLEDWSAAEATLSEMIRSVPERLPADSGMDILIAAAKTRLATLQEWQHKSFVLPLQKLLARPDHLGIYHATLYVHSFEVQPIEVRFADANVHLNALTQQRQQRTGSGVLVTIYDLSYSTPPANNKSTGSVEVKNKPNATQLIELRQSE